jgi:hypothetical protein
MEKDDHSQPRKSPLIEEAHIVEDNVPIHIFHAVANLWLAVQTLAQIGEHIEANHIHTPMKRLCQKYNLPLAEAQQHPKLNKLN